MMPKSVVRAENVITANTKMAFDFDFNISTKPTIRAASPDAQAAIIGIVRKRLLKKVSPPRWSNTPISKKKNAKSTIIIINRTREKEPSFVFGKKVISIFSPPISLYPNNKPDEKLSQIMRH